MSDDDVDLAFTMPAVDDDPATEIGVLLMGFGSERLLAGLGVAGPGDDAVLVTLLVDQLRHGIPTDTTLAAAVTAGAGRWRLARPALVSAQPGPGMPSAALRARWAEASAAVTAATGQRGQAEHVYLTACWLRRDEIDGCCPSAY